MVSMDDLESKGAKCEVVATDWWICTDSNGKKWWCSDHGRECVPEPTNTKPSGWPLWKNEAVTSAVLDMEMRKDEAGRALVRITYAVTPLEAVSTDFTDHDKRLSKALRWVQENKQTRDAAVKAASSPKLALPDALLANPKLIAAAAAAAAKEAPTAGAPQDVVSTLEEIASRYKKGVRRLKSLDYSVQALSSLQGMRDRFEVEGPLLRALKGSPDEANRQKLTQIVAVIRRPPPLNHGFPPPVLGEEGGCDWGCCVFTCIVCEAACVVCCAAACLLC